MRVVVVVVVVGSNTAGLISTACVVCADLGSVSEQQQQRLKTTVIIHYPSGRFLYFF